jgi:hypothetical protein
MIMAIGLKLILVDDIRVPEIYVVVFAYEMTNLHESSVDGAFGEKTLTCNVSQVLRLIEPEKLIVRNCPTDEAHPGRSCSQPLTAETRRSNWLSLE